jgi:hypothetical protein
MDGPRKSGWYPAEVQVGCDDRDRQLGELAQGNLLLAALQIGLDLLSFLADCLYRRPEHVWIYGEFF